MSKSIDFFSSLKTSFTNWGIRNARVAKSLSLELKAWRKIRDRLKR